MPKTFNYDDDEFDIGPLEDNTVEVDTPSGNKITLLNQAEADFYSNIRDRYSTDNKLTNISDFLELDRVLVMETMCFRWGTWILQERDYEGNYISPNVQKDIANYSKEIRDVKSGLGIDKKTRDGGKGETPADFIANLLHRAKEFGYHRDKQVIRAHTILKELQSKITLYNNSTDTERTEFNHHARDIFEWLEGMFAEFDEMDKAF